MKSTALSLEVSEEAIKSSSEHEVKTLQNAVKEASTANKTNLNFFFIITLILNYYYLVVQHVRVLDYTSSH